jgi:hypothetical protein
MKIIGINENENKGPGEMLKKIIEDYGISPESLSKITKVDAVLIKELAEGRGNLFELSEVTKVTFTNLMVMLSIGLPSVNEDDRVKSIIELLNEIYEISYETIAIYAQLDREDILQFLHDSNSVSFEKKYKIAVIGLFLHYIFK